MYNKVKQSNFTRYESSVDVANSGNSAFEPFILSEERFRSIIDSALDAIIVFDQENRVVEWNKQAEKIFGRTRNEVLGQDVAAIAIAPKYREIHYAGMKRFLESGESKILNRRVLTEGIRKDGTIFPVESTATGYLSNGVYYFTAFIRDLTERERYERNRELLAAIVESSDDAMISKTLDGTITSWNAGAERIFGYTPEEAIGQNIRFLIPADRLDEEEKIRRNIKSGERIRHYETVRQTKDGRLRDISVSISPLKDPEGHIIGASKIARDITDRKKTEVQLAEYMTQLKESNEALDDFVYIISHDLKEPLRGIYNYALFLLEDYGDQLDDKGKDMLETLRTLAHRMEELIDTLLKYSRLGRTELAFKETDLNRVLQETLELMEPLISTENVIVKIQDDLPVMVCDRARVSEIFRNLITNGIKYNQSKVKRIEVGYRTGHPAYPNCKVFFVKDNGIGIPEKYHDTVFKMFKRLHGRDEYGGGTGSGLPIVRKIVERHHGKIWIESGEESGSTFCFTLERG